jgi:hypothetical protein
MVCIWDGGGTARGRLIFSSFERDSKVKGR